MRLEPPLQQPPMTLPAPHDMPEVEERIACILVVEDSIALRLALAEWLRQAGYAVLEAASADEAVILLNSLMMIDLVITDIEMPGALNGYDLVRHIQQMSALLPIITVSGNVPGQKLHEVGIIEFFR